MKEQIKRVLSVGLFFAVFLVGSVWASGSSEPIETRRKAGDEIMKHFGEAGKLCKEGYVKIEDYCIKDMDANKLLNVEKKSRMGLQKTAGVGYGLFRTGEGANLVIFNYGKGLNYFQLNELGEFVEYKKEAFDVVGFYLVDYEHFYLVDRKENLTGLRARLMHVKNGAIRETLIESSVLTNRFINKSNGFALGGSESSFNSYIAPLSTSSSQNIYLDLNGVDKSYGKSDCYWENLWYSNNNANQYNCSSIMSNKIDNLTLYKVEKNEGNPSSSNKRLIEPIKTLRAGECFDSGYYNSGIGFGVSGITYGNRAGLALLSKYTYAIRDFSSNLCEPVKSKSLRFSRELERKNYREARLVKSKQGKVFIFAVVNNGTNNRDIEIFEIKEMEIEEDKVEEIDNADKFENLRIGVIGQSFTIADGVAINVDLNPKNSTNKCFSTKEKDKETQCMESCGVNGYNTCMECFNTGLTRVEALKLKEMCNVSKTNENLKFKGGMYKGEEDEKGLAIFEPQEGFKGCSGEERAKEVIGEFTKIVESEDFDFIDYVIQFFKAIFNMIKTAIINIVDFIKEILNLVVSVLKPNEWRAGSLQRVADYRNLSIDEIMEAGLANGGIYELAGMKIDITGTFSNGICNSIKETKDSEECLKLSENNKAADIGKATFIRILAMVLFYMDYVGGAILYGYIIWTLLKFGND